MYNLHTVGVMTISSHTADDSGQGGTMQFGLPHHKMSLRILSGGEQIRRRYFGASMIQ